MAYRSQNQGRCGPCHSADMADLIHIEIKPAIEDACHASEFVFRREEFSVELPFTFFDGVGHRENRHRRWEIRQNFTSVCSSPGQILARGYCSDGTRLNDPELPA